MGSDARIDQPEGHSPGSLLFRFTSHEGCPKHDLKPLEHGRCTCGGL